LVSVLVDEIACLALVAAWLGCDLDCIIVVWFVVPLRSLLAW